MVKAWSDRRLASETITAIRKIESVLPDNLRKEIELEAIRVPAFQMTEGLSNNLERIRTAMDGQLKLAVRYRSLKGEETERVLWPLILYFWGNKWTLGAWCELREDFRSFRVDLMRDLTIMEERFDGVEGKDLKAYVEFQSGSD